ncbi:hypothetical protein BEN74_14605 [Acinetobacter sp. WCHAc010034]|uniref:hypothetical protein n=1 Tax=Acinetobacter sp. WCHAc010034 TaxID=1879049 RepID=UPI00083A98AA|nr:hypothetical protein BEN74_14605 [Acinetobacter sp. WCHAc010034]
MPDAGRTLEETAVQNAAMQAQKIISLNKFIFLSVISFGLYPIWWMFEAWRFFMQKDRLDIMPAARAVFALIFLYRLLDEIKDYAEQRGAACDFSTGFLYGGFLILSLLARLPDPYWLVSVFAFIFLIPAFQALNHAKRNTHELNIIEARSFSIPQILLIIIGAIFWLLLFAAFILSDQLQ